MIYYPHYTPSNQHLRSILLFSDQVTLLVPEVDQDGVMLREHVRGLIAKQPNIIDLLNPQNHRFAEWVDHPQIQHVLQNIIKDASDQILASGISPIRKSSFGDIEPGQEIHLERLRSVHGWKYVAAEKFPYQIHDAVFDSNCAVRVGTYRDANTRMVIEHNGVICHPLLADFILCRMARQASIVKGLPSITFGGTNYIDHLFDGEQRSNGPQQELMQASLDLFVPDNLSSLTADEFFSIRNEYSELRRSVSDYLSSMVAAENLNMTTIDQKALFDRIMATRQKIEHEMTDVADAIGRQRFLHSSALALEASATLIGAAIGVAFSGFPGAVFGAGIGFAGGKFAHKLSTVGNLDGKLKSVAMTKAKVERMGVRKRWNAPSYWMNVDKAVDGSFF